MYELPSKLNAGMCIVAERPERGVKRGRSKPGGRTKGGRYTEKGILGRVQDLDSGGSVWQRLERLEAKVEASCHQQAYKHTNSILTQILSELRTINSMLAQDEHKVMYSRQQKSCHLTTQRFIIASNK